MKSRSIACALGLLAASSLYSQISIVGPLDYVYEIGPGRLFEGSIQISNPSDEPQEVKAYQSDYFFFADGTSLYGEPGGLPRSNARWIILSPRQVTIPPKETVALSFAIQVPNDSTLRGTYWSLILIEPIPLTSPESTRPGAKPGVGIAQVVRYGVQIITQVGDSGAKLVKFSQLKLVAEGGKRTLTADIENTGERWLRGAFSVDLYDSAGVFVGKFKGGEKRMFPQTSVRYAVDLIGVPNGTYKALLVVDCGGDDVFGVSVNLVLKD